MRILVATLSTPGFVFPLLAVADALRARGDDVAFVADLAFAETLRARGHRRIARGAADGPSFRIESWGEPLNVAIQVRHLEAALGAFAPHAILASHLALGPLVARELHGIPVAVLGPIVLPWRYGVPAAEGAPDPAWRYAELRATLERARLAFGLAPSAEPYERSLLFGDVTLLQGVAGLQAGGADSGALRVVGSCMNPSADARLDAGDAAWLRAQRAAGRKIVYVHLGRTFDHASFWPAFVRWIAERDASAVVCTERYDRAVGAAPPNVLLRERVSLAETLPFADAVVCGGHPTAVLAAASHALPVLAAFGGSGTENTAEAIARYGSAIALASDGLSDDAFTGALDRLLSEAAYRERAGCLRAEFARHDGPAEAAAAIAEIAAREPAGAA
ncbi:MAG TPA: nucleotide disphospho-sugar-binding domain-containing protein [Candidatus Elarobacter sp.]|nr:nucleotide disphospho-sugar-binding domain-containing protein [Candidatus Elarobacter sp.]